MILLTIAIALLGITVVLLSRRPGFSLGIVIASMLLYPEYMRVPMGLAQMSVPRLIAVALVVRLIAGGALRGFRFHIVDYLVGAWWVWDVLANCMAGSDQAVKVWVIGRFFDTILMYWAARLALRDRMQLRAMIPPVLVSVAILGSIGIIESVTFRSPYHFLEPYDTFSRWGAFDDFRYGLLRARGTSGLPATFGLTIFMAAAMLHALRRYSHHRRRLLTVCIVGMGGTMASLSSGPLLVIGTYIVATLFILRPRLIRPTALGMVLLCVSMEVCSNRHFYYLTEYINFFGGDYWYRCKLVDVAIEQLHEYWLIGLGGRAPDWGRLIDGRTYVDLVNYYLTFALSSGLLGMFLYLGAQVASLGASTRLFRRTTEPAEKAFSFSLGAMLVAVMLSGFQVTLLGPPNMLAFMLMGMMVTPVVATRQQVSKAVDIRRAGKLHRLPAPAKALGLAIHSPYEQKGPQTETPRRMPIGSN